MNDYRARIVAIVSSSDQAGDDRSSLDEQVKRSRAALKTLGWREVAQPIRAVTSRDFFRLSDLRANSPEFDELCAQVERGELDLVVGRDHSRVLGRTPALQMEFRTFLQLHRVQAYFYMRPTPPVPPSKLGRRGAPQIGGDYVGAVVAVSDDEEIRRLVQRREEGMNRHAADGRWRHSVTPFGYTRPVIGVRGERKLRGEVELDKTVAVHLKRAARAFLDGASVHDVGRQLAQQTSGRWPAAAVSAFLSNPFYAGVLVWGAIRADVVMADGTPRKVERRLVSRRRVIELAEAVLDGADARTPEEIELGIIVSRGTWEPLFTPAEWLELQQVRRRRRRMIGDRAITKGRHVLTGIAACDHCGGPMTVTANYYGTSKAGVPRNTAKRVAVYGCARRKLRQGCVSNYIRADRLSQQLYEQLRALLSDTALVAASIVDSNERNEADARLAALHEEMAASERASARWDSAYEAGTMTLAEWQTRRAPHRAAVTRIQQEIAALLSAAHHRVAPAAERIQQLRDLADSFEQIERDNPARLREALARIITEVRIRDKRIVKIKFS